MTVMQANLNEKHETLPKADAQFKFTKITLLWILVSLFTVDFVLNYLKPFRYIKIPGVILRQQDHIDYKIQSVLSPDNSFDTLLMGSSLAEAAAINADASLGLINPTVYSASRYNQALYFDRLRKEKLNQHGTTFSSAIGGSMISDQELILEKVFQKKQLPKQVLLMVEPRGFIDATRSPDLYPVTCYMKWRYKDFSKVQNLEDGLSMILSNAWTYFRFRSDFSTLLNILVDNCKDGSQSIDIKFEDPTYNHDRALDPKSVSDIRIYYGEAYKSVSPEKIQAQLSSLKRIIASCKEHRVSLFLVAAPLAKENRRQLPFGFEEQYNLLLSAISKETDVPVYNLTDIDEIKDTDYIDYVHLNSSGAVKFWKIVVNLLGKKNESQG